MTGWVPQDLPAVIQEFVIVNQILLEINAASVHQRDSTILIVKSAIVILMVSPRTSLLWEDVPMFQKESCVNVRMRSLEGSVTPASLCFGTSEAATPQDVSLVIVTGMEPLG